MSCYLSSRKGVNPRACNNQIESTCLLDGFDDRNLESVTSST